MAVKTNTTINGGYKYYRMTKTVGHKLNENGVEVPVRKQFTGKNKQEAEDKYRDMNDKTEENSKKIDDLNSAIEKKKREIKRLNEEIEKIEQDIKREQNEYSSNTNNDYYHFCVYGKRLLH